MTPDMLERLQLLAKLLLDARVAAAAVLKQAQNEGEPWLGDYDMLGELGLLRERVRMLMAPGEEK